MKFSIDFDYSKTMRQVETLRSISSELSDVGKNQFEDCMDDVSKNWKCDNSKKYINKGDKLKGYIVDSSSDILKAADALERIAANLYNAEKRNTLIAKK